MTKLDAVRRLLARRECWWADLDPPLYFSYAPDTGELLEFGSADPSPLEPGVWLLPGSATWVRPPEGEAGFTSVFRDGEWHQVRDRRGEVVYIDGEFRAITTLGAHEDLTLTVHDAVYVLPSNDEDAAAIRMWVNEDVIEFADDPGLIARQALAAWEAAGETIRPVEVEIETVEERDARIEAAKVAWAAEQKSVDAVAASAVEGYHSDAEAAP